MTVCSIWHCPGWSFGHSLVKKPGKSVLPGIVFVFGHDHERTGLETKAITIKTQKREFISTNEEKKNQKKRKGEKMQFLTFITENPTCDFTICGKRRRRRRMKIKGEIIAF